MFGKKRWVTGVILVTAVLTALTGCSSGNSNGKNNSSSPSSAPSSQVAEKATLRLATAMDPARLEPYNTVVEKWNAEHPDTQVIIENTPYAEYWSKLQVMTASNSMPDIWVFTPGLGAQWLENGQLLALDDYIKQDSSMNMDDYNKMMIDYMTYDGKVYGFPYDVSAQVLFYNKDLFDQAQLEYPTNDWTFEDVRNAAKKITELKSDKGKVYGMLSMMAGDFTADSYFRAFGATLVTSDGKIGINNQGGIDTLNYFKENIELGITPKPVPGQGTRPIWLNGLAGMMADGGWAIPSFKDVPFEWDMVKLPAGPTGQFTTGLGGTFVVTQSTKFPQQAYDFLKYLTGTESLNEIITKTDAGVPGRISSQEGLSPLTKKYAELIESATPYNAINGTLEMHDTLGKELEEFFLGYKPAEDILKSVEEKGNKAIEDKMKK